MTKTAKPAPRDLSISDLQTVGGGASPAKIKTLLCPVAPLRQTDGGGFLGEIRM